MLPRTVSGLGRHWGYLATQTLRLARSDSPGLCLKQSPTARARRGASVTPTMREMQKVGDLGWERREKGTESVC